MNAPESGERLQKVLAAAGVGSRRDCEELIRDGRVEVDRRVVSELGFRVHPETQEIRVDGEVVRIAPRVYYLVNKPQGVVSTNFDPDGRQRVIDLVPPHDHLFTVGRLDRSSEGLILVTNDGELANRLAHPRYGIAKTYRVEVAGHPSLEQLEQLKKGVHLAEAKVQASEVRLKKKLKQSSLLEIVLREGRNREIRRMLAKLGHKVLRLKRIALGPLKLGEIPPRGFRRLDRDEVAALRNATSSTRPAPGGAESRRRASRPSRLPRASRPSARANRSLGMVLGPESNDFAEYQEAPAKTEKKTGRGGKTPQGAARGRLKKRPAASVTKTARRDAEKPRRKKRPR